MIAMGSAVRTVRSVSRMGWLERVLFVRVLLLFCAAEAAVRALPIRRAASIFGVRLSLTDPGDLPTVPERVVLKPTEQLSMRAVRRISPRVYGPARGCLRRSLVVGRVLRRLEPTIELGAQRRDGELIVHAWVNINGHRLDAAPDLLPFRTP
jgi:hypothetical protein